eukprot:2990022-Rhodomonas_salina.1
MVFQYINHCLRQVTCPSVRVAWHTNRATCKMGVQARSTAAVVVHSCGVLGWERGDVRGTDAGVRGTGGAGSTREDPQGVRAARRPQLQVRGEGKEGKRGREEGREGERERGRKEIPELTFRGEAAPCSSLPLHQ